MKKHIELLGILHIIYHALGLAIALVVLIMIGGGLFISFEENPVRDIAMALSIYKFLAVGLLFMITLCSVFGIIGGIGLLKMRPWGRILALIMGFISLIRIPFGTALGVYTIWALMNDKTIQLFKEANSESAGVGTAA